MDRRPPTAPRPTTYHARHDRGDYRVMAVLTKIKALQTECQRAGIPVPLDAVLRRERALNLPGGGGGQAPPPQAKKPAAPKKKTTTAGKEEEGKGQKAGQAKAAATVAADDAPASGPVAAAPSVSATAAAAVAPRGSKRRPPQTLFEWLHLLSPLLTLVFGILYALTRAVGTGSGRKSGP